MKKIIDYLSDLNFKISTKLNVYCLNNDVKWYHFWNRDSGVIGSFIFFVVLGYAFYLVYNIVR